MLDQTPLSHPSLFIEIQRSDVVPGDIFQGTKNPRKWYENTAGQGAVDNFRRYWRRKPATLTPATQATEQPGATGKAIPVMPETTATAATAAPRPAGEVEERDMLILLGFRIGKEAFTKLIGAAIDDGDATIVSVKEQED